MASSTSTDAESIAKTAKQAFESSQLIPSSERVSALKAIVEALNNAKAGILAANKEDLEVCNSQLLIGTY